MAILSFFLDIKQPGLQFTNLLALLNNDQRIYDLALDRAIDYEFLNGWVRQVGAYLPSAKLDICCKLMKTVFLSLTERKKKKKMKHKKKNHNLNLVAQLELFTAALPPNILPKFKASKGMPKREQLDFFFGALSIIKAGPREVMTIQFCL